ncbi:MAG: site-specific integrase [Actinobacteria bacterium]|nr:site-specific integrase [Actinomycetota bacterium]
MSVERVERKDGSVVWRVRWRQSGRNRSKVLGRKRDAEAFDAELRRRKRTGELALLDAGKQPLAEFGEEWWRLHAEPNLAPATLELYAMLWDTHVLPRLGATPLRELTPELIHRFRLDLEAAGTGRVSVRKSLTLLHGVLQRACEWGRLQSNPARVVPKPSAARARSISPLPPETVESIRVALLSSGLPRDATLVSVLAYAGLRPGEALALTWGHIRERTILIEASVSLGAIAETKTRKRRTVRLLAPLAQDLAESRLRAGRPGEDTLVFPDSRGKPWTRTTYQNWRRRIYVPAAEEAGIANARPYDLRHSFVSLLIAEGQNVVDIARQAGHSPTMALNTYAHVFEEFDPADRISAADRIQQAREQVRFAAMQPRLFDVA